MKSECFAAQLQLINLCNAHCLCSLWGKNWIFMLLSRYSPRRSGFDSRLVHVKFLVRRVTIEQSFLHDFCFPLSVSFHQCSILILVIYMLLLAEGQAGEAWEASSKSMLFPVSGSTWLRMLSRCVVKRNPSLVPCVQSNDSRNSPFVYSWRSGSDVTETSYRDQLVSDKERNLL